MSTNVSRRDRREFKRTVGPVLSEVVMEHSAKIHSLWAWRRRGFMGRLKWLIFGR